MAELTDEERTWHRKQAASLFNLTWDYMEKEDRSPEEDDTMINASHASRYHWQLVGDAKNLSVGEWQLSRVYSILGRAEPAQYHAKRCLCVTEAGDCSPFHVAYAHEAMARSAKVAGDSEAAARHVALAREAAKGIKTQEDRKLVEADLGTIYV
jgi:hypothetical protein